MGAAHDGFEWVAVPMGNTHGTVCVDDRCFEIDRGEPHHLSMGDHISFACDDGKFSDSEDGYLFCYCAIDPNRENFQIGATFEASATDAGIDQQSGFGIVVADSVASQRISCRHRNQLMLGWLERQHGFVVRIVSGHSDSEACGISGARVVDESRRFNSASLDPLSGMPIRLELEKTDEGFNASFNGERIFIPGCDFLMKQDNQTLNVGFSVARGMRITISDVRFITTSGKASHTPEGAIAMCVPDYPFSRSVLEDSSIEPASSRSAGVLFASPDGNSDAAGTKDDPLTIEQAIAHVLPGARIVLGDGVYRPRAPLVVPAWCCGEIGAPITVAAEHARAVVIDGSSLEADQPLFVLDADFWHVDGLVFRNSPLCGLTVFGSANRIENCEACGNGDTGILIISRPGALRSSWPHHNSIVGCDSHDNCDKYCSNADGFGAKLRVGSGNSFFRCIAHHNIDDGFDLYTKALYGQTGPVELDCCVAYGNGALGDASRMRTRPGGVGFKLGGEEQHVVHEAWNCIAFDNGKAGFGANSNPSCELHFCTAARNGDSQNDDYRLEAGREGERALEESSLLLDASSVPHGEPLAWRDEKGIIQLNDCFAPRKRGKRREGASIDERKRILLIVDSLGGGGAERVACRLANALCERHTVSIFYFANKENRYSIDSRVQLLYVPPAISYWKLPMGGTIHKIRLWADRVKSVAAICKQLDIDVSISMLSAPNLMNALAIGKHRRIVCERNDPSMKPIGCRLKSKISFALADFGVFQSKKVQNQYPAIIRAKTRILPNPVEVTSKAVQSASKRIVTVGRLHPQKNYPMLIRAFAAFHASHPQHTLHIYGRGDQLESLRSLADSCCPDGSVRFEGFCDNVHAAIADAQMFVLSSDFEGMSNALIEAMMMGLPCISTACTGSDELIHDGEDGLLVPVGDAAAMCSALCRLSDDSALRETIAKAATIRALDYSLESAVRAWERLL